MVFGQQVQFFDLVLSDVLLPLEFLAELVCREGDAYVGLDAPLQAMVHGPDLQVVLVDA